MLAAHNIRDFDTGTLGAIKSISSHAQHAIAKGTMNPAGSAFELPAGRTKRDLAYSAMQSIL